MPAPGEFTKSFVLADVNPFVDSDFTIATNAAKISGGGLKDAVSGVQSGPAKVIYTGQPLNRAVDIVARVEIKEGGNIWNDPFGAGLFVETGEDEGNGYWIRINGNDARIHKVNSNDGGALLNGKFATITVAAGDIFEIRISPAGLITGKQNSTTLFTTTDTTYLPFVFPSAASSWENSNAHTILSFGADGIASDALGILDVNGNDIIVSKGQIVIACTKGDTVTGVDLDGVALTISSQSYNSVTCAPFDIHATAWYPGESLTLEITDGVTSPTVSVTLDSEPGYEYTIATGIDAEDEGLLKDTTQAAVIGDGYDGPLQIGASNITYYADGPHRLIDPALPNGSTSTGFFFDASLTAWETMDETTNQESAQRPVWLGVPAPPGGTVGIAYAYNVAHLLTGDEPITLQNVGDALPLGLAISGLDITGTPSTAGTTPSMVFMAVNAQGTKESSPFSLTINEGVNPTELSWEAIPPASSTEGTASHVSVKPYVTGSVGALHSWRLVGGPSGFVIDDEGKITGSATVAAGSYALIPEVSDDNETESAAPFIWTVDIAPPADLPDITAAMRRIVVYETINQPYSFAQVLGDVVPYSLNLQPLLDSRKTTIHSVDWEGGSNIDVTHQQVSGAIAYAELTSRREGTRTIPVTVLFDNGTSRTVFIEVKTIPKGRSAGDDY